MREPAGILTSDPMYRRYCILGYSDLLEVISYPLHEGMGQRTYLPILHPELPSPGKVIK